ncbi:MAG: SMC-Scp complex subunit ScpB [Clostridium sp.]|nr:MAG: SMC-Scp complex subunit ScpB [Clostridium sp.]
MDNIKETIEALIFASGEPVSKKDIIERIPSLTTRELNKIVEELKVKYGGDSGIVLASFNDKLQFTSNPRYGDTLVEVLTPIREKALSQSLLEVLSIIAYKQPVTRQEIEDIKGGKDPDYALSVLMKVNLIEVKGRKDAVGRPFLFGTTDEFLRKFQLEDLGHLPDYNEVLDRISILDKNFRDTARDGLYFWKRNLTSISPTLSKLAAQCRSFRQKISPRTRRRSSPKTTTISTIWTRNSTTFPTF